MSSSEPSLCQGEPRPRQCPGCPSQLEAVQFCPGLPPNRGITVPAGPEQAPAAAPPGAVRRARIRRARYRARFSEARNILNAVQGVAQGAVQWSSMVHGAPSPAAAPTPVPGDAKRLRRARRRNQIAATIAAARKVLEASQGAVSAAESGAVKTLPGEEQGAAPAADKL